MNYESIFRMDVVKKKKKDSGTLKIRYILIVSEQSVFVKVSSKKYLFQM